MSLSPFKFLIASQIFMILFIAVTTVCLIRRWNRQSKEFCEAMKSDTKDFHSRLCEIEANRKK